MRTHKSTSKRFRISQGGKGKLMRTKQGKSHFRRKKTRRLRAQFDELHVVDNHGIEQRVRRLAPYLSKQS
ncbi:MAG: 50S ribosomal protein L35 [Anaerolineae bacterium]|jgi:large subunit ribosomal protein L35|nr:50S ribosomal protein L35 [Anaerolineae bacterium]